MISFNSSCLRGKHGVLLRTWAVLKFVNVPSRASSLSAIHRGLRSSEKARPQGFKKTSLNTTKSKRHQYKDEPFFFGDKPPRMTPTFKIQKGKKDITYAGPKPKSRQARFYDPDDPFGKKSLVYQMKSSNLREKMARMTERGQPVTGRQPKDRLTEAQFSEIFESGSGQRSSPARRTQTARGSTATWQTGGRERPQSSSRPIRASGPPRSSGSWDPTEIRNAPRQTGRRERPQSFSDRPVRASGPPRSSGSWDSTKTRNAPRQTGRRERSQSPSDPPVQTSGPPWSSNRWGSAEVKNAPRPTQDQEEDEDSQPAKERQSDRKDEQTTIRRSSSRDSGPIRIPRTTAASQFLYGQSVVEAALKETGRELYKLYLYCGEYRQDVSRTTGLEGQASRANVPITKVTDADGLRMMDKMSEGRPHNGCVLEASPLPQLPLRALGPIVVHPAPGFGLELAHQSFEEELINGTSDTVKCNLPPNRNPFVLLLDQIQDPGNLGAIVRSAAFLGVNAIVVTRRNSATMTAVALKASAGASEVMNIFSVDSTLDFLNRSKESGWVVYAAVAPTSRPRESKHVTLDRVDTYDPLSTSPTILMIGSEGEGLSSKTRRLADFEVSIPKESRFSAVESLNVSVATGILCSAFLKKQFSTSKFDNIIDVEEDESRVF